MFEIYHFTKSDAVSASNKFELDQSLILDTINSSNNTVETLNGEGLKLSPEFKGYLYNIVNKRCRPFINKRDFLQGKMKEIQKDSESRFGLNFHMLLDSVVRKEKVRVNK